MSSLEPKTVGDSPAMSGGRRRPAHLSCPHPQVDRAPLEQQVCLPHPRESRVSTQGRVQLPFRLLFAFGSTSLKTTLRVPERPVTRVHTVVTCLLEVHPVKISQQKLFLRWHIASPSSASSRQGWPSSNSFSFLEPLTAMPLGPWSMDVLRAAGVGHLPLAGRDFPAAPHVLLISRGARLLGFSTGCVNWLQHLTSTVAAICPLLHCLAPRLSPFTPSLSQQASGPWLPAHEPPVQRLAQNPCPT